MEQENEKEVWKVYKKTRQSIWEVSNLGRVKKNGEIYECGKNGAGYLCLSNGDFLHRAIAECFIPNPDNKPCVDHIDTNKMNNRVDNLEWVTYSENMLNPITRKHNSESGKGKHSGEKNGMYGKIHSIETRKKISESNKEKLKGRVLSEEHKKNISKSNTGKVFSEEHIKNLSESRKGKHLVLCSDGKRHFV